MDNPTFQEDERHSKIDIDGKEDTKRPDTERSPAASQKSASRRASKDDTDNKSQSPSVRDEVNGLVRKGSSASKKSQSGSVGGAKTKDESQAMSDNRAFEGEEGPEDAVEAVHGTYRTLEDRKGIDNTPTHAQIQRPKSQPSVLAKTSVPPEERSRPTSVQPSAAGTQPQGTMGEKGPMPESFKVEPQGYRYSQEKKALEALGEVIDIAKSITADKPYAGMGKEDLLKFSQTPFWSRFRTVCTIIFWLVWAALLGAVIGLTITFPKCQPPPDKPWHETAIMYQIYVRSFYDSSGDGVGDLNGIRMKLDYLSQDLGVNALILSSFYEGMGGENPDHGYEVVDHKAVDQEYGTMEEFEMLLQEAHDAGIHIILDFIPNYTGTGHPWFIQSSQNGSFSNPYWNYYVWADCPTAGVPPVNNWRTVYGQSMWTFNGTRGGTTDQCYLHQFLNTQPELNLRSKAVQMELESILRFWLDLGVDGFRIDKVQHLFEDVDFRDEVQNGMCSGPDPAGYECYVHNYTTSQDEIYPLVAQWRQIIDEYTDNSETPRVLITDSSDNVANSIRYYGKYGPDGANFPLNFELTRVNTSCDSGCVWRLADEFLYGVPNYAVANWMTGSQNIPRFASVINESAYYNAYTMLKLTMPGAAIMYYGEEIGMSNVNLTAPEDPAGGLNPSLSRDPYRTPMQWTMDPENGGFIDEGALNDSLPWLPVGENLYNISVMAQNSSSDMYTPFKFYQSLVDLRTTSQTFNVGSFQYALLGPNIISYFRSYEGLNRYLVAINFGTTEGTFNIRDSYFDLPDQADVVMATSPTIDTPPDSSARLGRLRLRGGDGVIVTWPYVRPDGK